MSKHILVISQYFYPEQFRINDICTEWVKRGYRVTVLTGIPNYPQGKYYEGYGLKKKRKEVFNGIGIVRIPLIPRGKSSIMLLLNYISFVISGFFWEIQTNIKAEYVFIFGLSPITLALPGVWYSKRKKVPSYIYVQDLWPDSVEIVTGITNKAILNTIGKITDYIYANCSKIFVTSNSFVTSIVNRGVPKNKIEYWPQYAEDAYQPIKRKSVPEIPDDNAFNIIFAGNIGKAQGLDILVETALLLKTKSLNQKIRFNIVGDGRYKEELLDLVKQNDVADMFIFIKKQPVPRIPELMAVNDAAILCLLPSALFSMTIPAKLQSYMACGIPIIASADGETAQIIGLANCGLCSPAGDAKKLAENICEISQKPKNQLSQLSVNALKFYNENFDKKKLLDKLDQYFKSTSI